MIKAIICDTDGMLVNGEMFSDLLLKKYGISKEMTTPFFTGEFQDCLVGKADLKQTITKYLKTWGWNKSVEDLLTEWFKFEHRIDQELVTYLNLLKDKGIKLYLATNQEKYRTEYILNVMGFNSIFDQVFSSAHIGHKKPNQEFFDKIHNQIGVAKNQVVFWDDQQKNVDAAKDFGFNSELYTTLDNFQNRMNSYLDD